MSGMECHPEIDRCPLDYELDYGLHGPFARVDPRVLRQAEIDNYTCVCGDILPDVRTAYPGKHHTCECGTLYMCKYGFRRVGNRSAHGWSLDKWHHGTH